MNFNKKTLENGLRIITVPMKENPAVAVLVMVAAGSKYETKNISGISHFLEHICFKGTIKRPNAIDISRELDGLGAQYNAFTSQEYTGYYAKSHPKYLPKIFDIISDMYLNPIFKEDEIEKEKGVIIEEINMYEDMPHHHVHDIFAELLYGDQPAGWNIAGTRETVKSMKREIFINYRDKHYVAENTVVIVAGNFDESTIHNRTKEAFSSMNTSKKAGKLKVTESQNSPQLRILHKETDQTHIVLGVRAFDIFNKKIPALRVLNVILGSGMSSRLFERLRGQMGVGYYVRSGTDEYTDHGFLDVSTGVDNTRVIEVVRAILDEFKKLKKPVSGEELKKAKDYFLGNMYLELETSDSLASFYGGQEILKGFSLSPDQIADETNAVKISDIQAIAEEIFQNKNLNIALIGKKENQSDLGKMFSL